MVFERMRSSSSGGPKIMIVGSSDVGKTSLCKILLNYAVKAGRSPLFVDLDTSQVENSQVVSFNTQASVSITGVLSATVIDTPVDVCVLLF